MTRIQWTLIALIITEAATVLWGTLGTDSHQPLPATRLNVLDPIAVEDIRRLESEHRADNRKDWLDLAAVYRTFGLLPEALFCYERAEKIRPLKPKDHFAWGICLSRFGEIEKAQGHLQEVIAAHHVWQEDAWLQIGLNYLRTEEPAKAEQALRNATQRPIAKLALARLLSRTRREKESIQLLQQLLERYPNGLRIHQLKAWVHEMQGEARPAEYHRDRVLRAADSLTTHDLSRQHDDQWFQKIGNGRFFFESLSAEEQGDLRNAIDLALAGLKAAWQEDRALRVIYLRLANQEPAKALVACEEFFVRVGESVESLTFAGEALMEMGKTEEAIKLWLWATRYRSSRFVDTNMRVHEKLKMAYEARGEKQKALRQQGFMELEKALLMWNRNEVRNSLVEFEEAMELVPDSVIGWYYLAETRRLLGDGSGARKAYQACLELDPQHGRAQRGLARLSQ